MSVVFVVNRASGTGRAGRLVDEFVRACEVAGERYAVVEARDAMPGGEAREVYFRRFRIVAVIGGDGTVHHLLPVVRAAGVPVYHIPSGTENLFAREFGMTTEPGVLLRAIEAGCTRRIDTARVGGREFVIMVSCGADAGVVHRLDEVRSRAAGHAMYLKPVVEEVLRPRVADVRVVVDGREVVSGARGMLVVANSRQYARRLDPACEADMTDGLLDVVFLPGRTTAKMVLWAVRCAVGEQLESKEAVWVRGREIEVVACGRTAWQCDGEAGGWLEVGESLRIVVEPGVVRVLVPQRG